MQNLPSGLEAESTEGQSRFLREVAPESLHADLLTGQGPGGGRGAPCSPRQHRSSPPRLV